MQRKRLILRLSSLGDLILASSILEVKSFTDQGQLDWVVASELNEVLSGHPGVQRIWSFDRRSGFQGWFRLCQDLWKQDYEEIYDLHQSLRTRIMRFLFLIWSVRRRDSSPVWKSISKQRVRLCLYYCFKKLWPHRWRPSPWTSRFTRLVGGEGKEKPNLQYLLSKARLPENVLQVQGDWGRYLCVMPGSRWKGKNWPVECYFELLKKISYFPVILGRDTDVESRQLCQILKAAGIAHFSAVGQMNLSEVATLLKGAAFYLGGDTGLAHLSESIGVPAKVIFGPTTPDMGFGPWRPQSQAVSSALWCRPCGKDGRSCHRLRQKHLCLKALSVDSVLVQIQEGPGH